MDRGRSDLVEPAVDSVGRRRLTSATGRLDGTANQQNKNTDQVNTKMLAAKKAAKKAVKKAAGKGKKKAAAKPKRKAVKKARAAKKAAKKAVKKAPAKKAAKKKK